MLVERIFVRIIALGKSFIHDHDLLGVLIVSFGESAPANHLLPERL